MSGPSYLTLLREEKSFRRLWLGELVSYLGDWFNTIAVYTSVQALTDSAQAIAAVMVAKTLPTFLVSPIAGPIIDRFDRRRLLIASDLARAVCVLGLIASHRTGSIAGLLAFTTVMIMFSGVVLPTRNAVLPMIVKPEDLPMANALGGGTWSIMLAIGAALGGFATQFLGVTASFLIDGVTFLLSASFFLGLPSLQPPAQEGPRNQTRFVDGVRYLLGDRYVLTLSLLKPMQALSMGAVAMVPLFGKSFGEGTGALYIGLLYTSRGIGALAGSMVVRLFVGDAPTTLKRSIFAGYLTLGAGFLVASFSESLWGVAFGYFLSAIGGGLNWVYSGTLLQLDADKRFHGRVFSIEFGLTTLAISASSWALTYGVDHGLTIHEAVRIAGSAVIIPLMVWGGTLLLRRGIDTDVAPF